MKGSVLSLPPHISAELGAFSEEYSSPLSQQMSEHWRWSSENFSDADKMCSPVQGLWMKQIAADRKAQRAELNNLVQVLDIGCYTGFSAMAWYEGTAKTQAEILTVENDPKMSQAAQLAINKYHYDDRIKIVEGSAEEVLQRLAGQFDIIFIDIAFASYQACVETVLERNLLSRGGVIFVDNVFARGFVVNDGNMANIDESTIDHWKQSGKLMRDFGSFLRNHPRVHVLVLPVFDGIAEIRWRE